MSQSLGIVQLAYGDLRPTAKAGRKLAGKSLLEWVVRRVTDCQRLGQVAVVLSDNAEERPLAELVPPDVSVYFAHHKDPLGRLVEALGCFGASAVVRVCADNPFVDPVWIDRLVTTAEAHPGCDYISYCSRDGKPVILSPLGMYAEWCSASALRAAHRQATAPLDRRHATRYLYSHPELFTVRLIPLPPELDREDLRLTIDAEEDWEHALAIHDVLGSDEWDWRRIAGMFDRQPALRNRVPVLNGGRAEE